MSSFFNVVNYFYIFRYVSGGDGHSHGHDHGHGTNSPMHENTSSHTHDHSSGDGGHDHDHSHESGHSHDHSHGGKPPPEFYGNTHKHGDESVHIQVLLRHYSDSIRGNVCLLCVIV